MVAAVPVPKEIVDELANQAKADTALWDLIKDRVLEMHALAKTDVRPNKWELRPPTIHQIADDLVAFKLGREIAYTGFELGQELQREARRKLGLKVWKIKGGKVV